LTEYRATQGGAFQAVLQYAQAFSVF